MANLAYQNVSNLFPKSEFTLQGPLAGAMGGLQTMYGLNDLNNSAALAEINKQAENLKLSEAQKNVPVDDLKRQVVTNDLTTDLGQTDARAQSKLDTYKKQGIDNLKTEAEARKQEFQNRSYVDNEDLGNFYDEGGNLRKSSLRFGRHAESGRPCADPQLLAAGKPRDIGVHDSADAPGQPADRRMRLLPQFLGRNVAQGPVQRLVDAGKGVKQDIVCDHGGILRNLGLSVPHWRQTCLSYLP